MDLIPVTESEKRVREEVNRRTWKAGYTDRDGQPVVRTVRSMAPSDAYRENYVRIFGHR